MTIFSDLHRRVCRTTGPSEGTFRIENLQRSESGVTYSYSSLNWVYCITAGVQENLYRKYNFFFMALCQAESLTDVIQSHSMTQTSLGREVAL